jgi:hypothetical protein
MRFRLQTNLKKKAIENGEKIQPNKAASCGRELLIDCSAHLRINTVESIEYRAENVCAWLSCGRTAEATLATYNLASWNFDEDALHTDWSMEKVASQKMLLFYSDAEGCYEIDFYHFYHNLFCYWLVGNGESYFKVGEEWVTCRRALDVSIISNDH